ncbi:hypothetical protein NP493_50g02032 [Ridgeia piscesae]|uniref:Uncharacterized protein n=1 Tax=Ridgeia piscesae TaxID=27915 RepID=A0AAD9PB75_RIDPI|nr:hypothetical protein NP493_50g02032 [Ridgeia piscesae]
MSGYHSRQTALVHLTRLVCVLVPRSFPQKGTQRAVSTGSTNICGHGSTQRDKMKPGSDEEEFDIKPRCVRVSDRSSFMRERVFSLGVQLEDPYEDFINGYSRLLRLAVIPFTPSPLFRVVPYRILPCLSRGDEV